MFDPFRRKRYRRFVQIWSGGARGRRMKRQENTSGADWRLSQPMHGRRIKHYRKNAVIYRQGDPAAVFCIHQGRVKLTVTSDLGKEAVIAIFGPTRFLRRRLSQMSGRLAWPVLPRSLTALF